MNIDLPTQYDPHAVEKSIYQKWLDSGAFHAVAPLTDEQKKQPRFSIVIPPPNVTGALHLGHAINGTIQDILTRYHRMKGDNTLWMPGIDHAGIATQAVVEKTIFEKEKKSRHDLGREELVRRIWEWKEQYGARILNQQAQLGASCDWARTRFTLDDICAKAVREAFFKMFSDGLIFRGKRLVNWDAQLQTAVADDEIYHETVKGQMTSIKYPVYSPRLAGGNEAETEFLTVATTRPETMLGDTALAVHPDDPRYQHLIGKSVIIPLVGRKIPIIADGLLVDPKFGTGVVKVTPAHDPNDYATGLRHNLEQINLLTPDGKMNEKGSGVFLGKPYSYVGLKFATAARKQILADLEELNLIADKKPHDHEVGHSDRSKTPIEPYLSDQWFVRMGDITNSGIGVPADIRAEGASGITLADGSRAPGLAQAAMSAVTSGKIKITPDRYAKGYLDWLAQKRDWCISRQLWWGHRIPVWTLSGPKPDYQKDSAARERMQAIESADESDGIAYRIVDHGDGTETIYVCQREGNNWTTFLESRGFTQDPDVLDTWFSSALWPISTMGWPNTGTSPAPEDQLLPYFYPTSVLSTARDILTLWVARMVIFGLYCHGQIPFKDVYIHAVIQDGEGRTMSKSKGNGVDPVDIINSHGADALRFTLASMATETQDIRMPVVKDPKTGTNTSPKFDIGRNFANKIWNASRFILSKIELSEGQKPSPISELDLTAYEDQWITNRLNETITIATNAIESFKFAELVECLRSFFWSDLCDWYIEIAKSRIKSNDENVKWILFGCLENILKLLHPAMPFITEEIWSHLPNREGLIISALWPKPIKRVLSVSINEHVQLNDSAEEINARMGLIQSLTSGLREIQNRYPAAKGKDVVIRPSNEDLGKIVEQSKQIIESIAQVKITQNSPFAITPPNAASGICIYGHSTLRESISSQNIVPPPAGSLDTPQISLNPEMNQSGRIEFYIGGVIDKTAKRAKLTKRREELFKLITANENKLNNEAFVGKAPAQIVQGLRDQLAKYKEELAAKEKNLAELDE